MITITQTDFDFIAGLEVACLCRCHGWKGLDGNGPTLDSCRHEQCKSVVHRFPRLWRECGCRGGQVEAASLPNAEYLKARKLQGHSMEPRWFTHPYCNGTGYVLIDSERRTDTLWEVADSIGVTKLTFYKSTAIEGLFCVTLNSSPDEGESMDSWRDALAQALRKALEA